MARPTNEALWDQWRQRVDRQRASGLSIAEFCRREHVSSHTFHAWRRKCRQTRSARHRPRETATAHRARKPRALVTSQRPFHRARGKSGMATGQRAKPDALRSMVAPDFLQLPVTTVPSSPWIELALADGTVLRLPQQNLAALLAVLRLLRGDPVELPRGEGRHA
jgi:transposase-like protein